MLTFVIPLKSQQVSSSWDIVSRLFERCLRSVCNQTVEDFQVLVICHEKPNIQFFHPQVQYVQVDFSPPEHDRRSKILDRARKELVGLIYAGKLGTSHILKMDADDCVSKHLAAFVNQHSQENGWYLKRGYVYTEGSSKIYLRRDCFFEWCGTCNIVRSDLFDIVKQRIEKLPELEEDYLKYYIKHARVADVMQQKGTPIKPLPFAGAIYILGHGENTHPTNSKNSRLINPKGTFARIKTTLVNLRSLTPKIRDEFGLYEVNY